MAGGGRVTRVNLTGILLRLRLALARSSAGALVAGALMLAAAALWFVLLPGLSARVDEHGRAVVQAHSAPLPKPVVSAQTLAAERLTAFYVALGSTAHTEQVVSRLFDAASDAAVVLDKAEYKPSHDSAGQYDIYTIILPVKGDYARLRSFCEKVLLTIPYAALEDMRFTRNSANDQAVEASLRFTVFLRPETAAWAFGSASASASAPTLTSSTRPASAPTSASASAPTTASKTRPVSAPTSASSLAPPLPPPLPPSFARTAVVEVHR
jgi:hypothetical protein